jgi:hypothetical protein
MGNETVNERAIRHGFASEAPRLRYLALMRPAWCDVVNTLPPIAPMTIDQILAPTNIRRSA